jgi:hypothetical protein
MHLKGPEFARIKDPLIPRQAKLGNLSSEVHRPKASAESFIVVVPDFHSETIL